MTKKKETGVLASAKEETLNQIITAQKEKIEALTAYGKKLKNQVKDYKEKIDANCEELIDAFQSDVLKTERLHQKVLILSVIAALLVGVIIGMSI